MATGKDAMRDYVSHWEATVTSLGQAVETWLENKIDANPNFDFTAAQTALETAKTNLETSVGTVNAM